MSFPIAKKVVFEHSYFNVKSADCYHWLKDQNETKSADIIDYLNSENDYCKAVHLDVNKPLTDTIYDEILSRINEDDVSTPVYRHPYYYYSRTEKGKQYKIYARKLGLNGAEEVLLDQNTLTHEYQSLGTFAVSPDHQILGYSLDLDGSEHYTCFFKDLKSGTQLDTIEKTAGSIAWFGDSFTVLYDTMDDIHRTDKVYRHVVGTPRTSDVLIFHETDQKFGVGFYKSNSGQYLFLDSGSGKTNETHFISVNDPTGPLTLIHGREFGHKYHVEQQGSRFLIRTNRGEKALNYVLCSAPITNPSIVNWVDVVPYDPFKHIVEVQPFENFIALHECFDGMKHIRILKSSNGIVDTLSEPFYASFEEALYFVDTVSTKDLSYSSSRFRFTYSSMTTAQQTWELDMGSKEKTMLKETIVPGGYDPKKYTVKRINVPIPKETLASAPHNTPVQDTIPVSIIYRKDLFKGDGSNPCLLYGYGSYSISIDPSFSGSRFSLLDRGFVYAIAHIRGGGDCGLGWYETGKFKHKRNTFTDFIAVGRHIVKEKFTSQQLLVIEGRSAGGLLIGAVLNMAPDLCGVAVAGVPFVDVINTMMDPSIPLTVNEYEEWGNPNEKDYFDYMLSYSPYDNIPSNVQFPDVLVKAGLNDPRVQYWEPAKWVAKMRDMKVDAPNNETKKSLIVFDCKMGSGHFGSSGRYSYLKEVAADYAFIIKQIQGKSKL